MPMIQIPASDNAGTFSCYVALPESTSAPVIVMIQEIFGVNAEMRRKCDEYAAKGFVAVAPDLFWRIEPDIQLTDQTQEEWDKAFELFGKFDVDKGIEDIADTIKMMRTHDASNGKVATTGYCLGGKLSYLSACRTDADANVGYYGVQIEEMLGESDKISKPLMLHIAEEDEFVNKEAQEKIHAGLSANPNVTLYSYAGVNHAFARINGNHYDEQAANLANSRTTEFLIQNLA